MDVGSGKFEVGSFRLRMVIREIRLKSGGNKLKFGLLVIKLSGLQVMDGGIFETLR